jgi:O-antigen/teichoic acid export membrane protein
MIAEIKKLVKHSGIYGMGIIGSKLVGFVMLPVYTRYLQPADYGTLEMMDLLVFFATSFASMGVYGAVFRFYAAYSAESDKKEVIGTALYFTGGSSLLISVMIFAGAPWIADGFLGSVESTNYVRIVGATFLFSNLCEVPMAYLQAQEKSLLFVGLGFGRTLLSALMLGIVLAVFRWGVLGVLLVNCFSNLLVSLILFRTVLWSIPRRLAREKLAEMLSYGLPMVLGALASFVLTFSDRFFLRKFGSLADVGVYALGYKLAMVVALLTNSPFALAWQWQQFDVAAKKDAKELYAKIQLYQLLVSLMVGIMVSLLARDALRILTPPTYWDGYRIVPLIVLCYIIDNVRTVILSGVLVRRTTHYHAWIGLVVALADLALNYLLIPPYLAMGAAVATLAAYSLRLGLTYWAAQHVYPVPYEYFRGGLALASAVALYLASTFVRLPVIPSIIANLCLMGIFGLAILLLLQPGERVMVRQIGFSAAQKLKSAFRHQA